MPGSFSGSSEAAKPAGEISGRAERLASLDEAIAAYEAQLPPEFRRANAKSLEMRVESGTLSIADQQRHRKAMAALRAIEHLRGALNQRSSDATSAIKSAAAEYRTAVAKINRTDFNLAIARYQELLPEAHRGRSLEELEAELLDDQLEVAAENRIRHAINVLTAIASLQAARQDPDADAASVMAEVQGRYEAARARIDTCSLSDEIARYEALIPLADHSLEDMLAAGDMSTSERHRLRKAVAAQRAIEHLKELQTSLEDPLAAMARIRSTFEQEILDLDQQQEAYRKSTLENAITRYQALIPDDLLEQSLSELQSPLLSGSLAVPEQVRQRKAIAALRAVNQLQAELQTPSGADPQVMVERVKRSHDEANAEAEESQGDYRKSTFNRAISDYQALVPDDLKPRTLAELEHAIRTETLPTREQVRYRKAIAAMRAIAELELESSSLSDPLGARDAVKASFESDVARAEDYRRDCFTSAINDFTGLLPPEFGNRNLQSLEMWITSGTLSLPEEYRFRSAEAVLQAIEALNAALQDPCLELESVLPRVCSDYEDAMKGIEHSTFGAAILKLQAQIPEDLQGQSLAELESSLLGLPTAEENRCRVAIAALRAIENLAAMREKMHANAAKALQHTETEYKRIKAQLGTGILKEAYASYRSLIPEEHRQSDQQNLERQLQDGALGLESTYWNRLAAAGFRAMERLALALDKAEGDAEGTVERIQAEYDNARSQAGNTALNQVVSEFEAQLPADLRGLGVTELEAACKEPLSVSAENQRNRALVAKQAIAALNAAKSQANLNILTLIERIRQEHLQARQQVDEASFDRVVRCFQTLVPPDLAVMTIAELEDRAKDRAMPTLENLRIQRAYAASRALERLGTQHETHGVGRAMDALAQVDAEFDAAMAAADRKHREHVKSTLNKALSRYQMEVRADLRGKSLADLEAQLSDIALAVPEQTRTRQAIAALRAIERLNAELAQADLSDPEAIVQAVREPYEAAIAEAERIQTDFDNQILVAAIARFKIRIPTACRGQDIAALQQAMSEAPEDRSYRQAIAALRAIERLEAEIRSRSPAPPQIVIERIQATYDTELTKVTS